MNITVPKKLLSDQLSLLERIVPSRSANPLYTYLGLYAEEGALILFGTNGEVDLEVRLPAEAQSLPRVLVPAQPFFQLVRSLPGDLVALGLASEPGQGGQLVLSSGRFRTRLSLAPAEGYPELLVPEGEDKGAFPLRTRMPSGELVKALTHVRYAASNEEYRAIFRGVQLEFSPQGFRAVASDGYRLALYDLPLPQGFQAKAVVPARSVDEMVRVLKGADGAEADLALGEGVLALALEGGSGVRMALRLMEGEFPDYQRVIPQEFALRVQVEGEALREAVRRVSVLSDRQNHRVELLLEEGRILLSAEGDYGKGQEEVPAQVEGPGMAVAYNARYLLEALAPVGDRAHLGISGPTSPSLIWGDGEGYRAVVVPLRV